MRPASAVFVLLLVAPVFAGCVANPIPRTAQAALDPVVEMAPNWYDAALGRGPGHNHADLSQHQGVSTPNFQLVGHAGLTTYDAAGRLVASWGCAEVGTREKDGRVLAIMNAFGRTAFVLADITDPANPFKVGEFTLTGVSGYDAAMTRDGKFGLLAFNALVRNPTLESGPAVGLAFEDACSGATSMIPLPDVAVHNGVILLDLDDPTDPKFGDYWPTPGVNLHSVATADVDGLQYVVVSIVNLVPAASYWHFLLAADTPAGGKLVPLSHFEQPPAAVSQKPQVVVPSFNGHGDASIQKHPVLGLTYAYLSAWDGGMITVDITVPTAPVMVANWVPPVSTAPVALTNGLTGTNCYPYAVHDVYPLEDLREGKHYLIAQQECPRPDGTTKPAGEIFILDNTNPLLPTLVGRWNLPVNTAPWSSTYVASPHYVTVVGDVLYASMYHAGLWAIDLSGDLVAPPSIGVYMPSIAISPMGANALAPSTLQVSPLADGSVALFEERTGVYVVRFDASDPAPPALPFFR